MLCYYFDWGKYGLGGKRGGEKFSKLVGLQYQYFI